MNKKNKWKKEFIEMLYPLNAEKQRIDAAFKLKNLHLPKSIFKYREINPNSIKNLEEDTIWLADPKNFNDPYDCAQRVNFTKLFNANSKTSIAKYLEHKGSRIKLTSDEKDSILNSKRPYDELSNHLHKDLESNKKRQLLKLWELIQQKAFGEMSENFSARMSSSFKLCSFSERLDSMLMWAHYANYHEGFCIEYDIDNRNESEPDYLKRFLYPVIYRNKMFDSTQHIKKDIHDQQFNNLYPSLASLIKAKDWKYEKEWRLVFTNNIINKEQTYEIGKPKAIYLGTKINTDNQKQLIDICTRKDLPIFKMKAHHNKYLLEPESIEGSNLRIFKQ